ncbi:MAG TPA: zinc-binding dehydrogenase [Pilimelia sp.]|nr:zinc-binding dehydrogenase [Pilimelia sp.]
MRAILMHEFGPAETLRFAEVADPLPGPGQVRIAVAAAGVHLLDAAIRAGTATGPFAPPRLPMIPGREVAGVVDALGDGAPPAWLGRRVVAHLGMASGGYAERAVCAATSLHALPDGLGFEAAVAMIGTGRTALAILDVAALSADDVVLVTAAAGGLGTLLVQAARRVGAAVVGVAGGPAKVDRVRELGATAAVDYTRPGWPDEVRAALAGRDITVVLDGVGGDEGRAALELIGMGGRLVLYGWAAGKPTPLTADDLYTYGMTASAAIGPRLTGRPGGLRDFEERSLAAAAAGTLVPVVGQTFPLARAADAHTAVETRATVGKTVLTP